MPEELLRWIMAERFHWTLAEVDALSLADREEFFQIEDGRIRAAEQDAPEGAPLGRFGRKRRRR